MMNSNRPMIHRAVANQIDADMWMVSFKGSNYVVRQVAGNEFKIYRQNIFMPIDYIQPEFGIESVIQHIEARN